MWGGSKDGSRALSEALLFVREATSGDVAGADAELAARGESRVALAGMPAMKSTNPSVVVFVIYAFTPDAKAPGDFFAPLHGVRRDRQAEVDAMHDTHHRGNVAGALE